MTETESGTCHHCGQALKGSPFRILLQGPDEDYALGVCRSCQSLRQSGQLPIDLLLQQWAYARSGPAAENANLEDILIQLECLGCGAPFMSFVRISPSSEPLLLPEARRLPDGSLSTVCGSCGRTNLLERRGGQLVAVRLW